MKRSPRIGNHAVESANIPDKPERDKDAIIHALNVALVEMATRIEMHRDLIEMLMDEREMYCAITPREEIN